MKKNRALTISLIAVALGILFGLLVVALTGRNPINMILAMIKSMTGFDLSRAGVPFNIVFVFNWFVEVLPLVLTGLSVAFAYRTGLFNIGAEGQYMVGATAASVVALTVKAPQLIHVSLCILAAMTAGALWALLPGFLKAYRNISEVVICIMLNYIGMHTSNYVIRYLLPMDTNTYQRTIGFPESAYLDQVIPTITSQFNWGFIVVIAAVIFFWFVIEKTSFGYSLKATGFNKDAAQFAGMKTGRNIILSMMISGALAGLAGAIVILGTFRYGRIYPAFDNYGFNGIPVALVGAASGIGVFLAGMLFGLLKTCSNSFQMFNIPKEISDLIQASIIYLIAIQYGIIYLLDKRRSKKEKTKEIEMAEGGNE